MNEELLPRRRAMAMAAPFVVYPLYLAVRGEARWETWGAMLLVVTLALYSPKSRKLMLGLYPIGLVGLFYDLTRFIQTLGVRTDTVHVCDLRAMEMRLFGIHIGNDLYTVHDWTLLHHSTLADILGAIPYGTFIFAAITFAVFLFMRSFTALKRFGWTFFLLNIAAFITYRLYPAAPPWYFHLKGCVVDVAQHASEGPALARVDAMMGVQYFHSFYARSHSVFGAVPSMHVSYPTLIVIEGWALFGRAMRSVTVLYMAAMFFGAVYLDHHWIIDVVIGLFYTLTARLIVGAVMSRLEGRAAA